jgi:hypothetical protein
LHPDLRPQLELVDVVDVAVINQVWLIQAIPWSGTFHPARSLIRSANNFSINSATVIAPSKRLNMSFATKKAYTIPAEAYTISEMKNPPG